MKDKDMIYYYILESLNMGKISKDIAAHLIYYLKQADSENGEKDIAIIGVHCKLGGYEHIDEINDMLSYGVDAITDIPQDRRKDVELFSTLFDIDKEQMKFNQHSYLHDIDMFDAEFFGIAPREASFMDPYQRIILESAWKAIEDAGYGGDKLTGSKTGVFIGHSNDFGEDYKKMIQILEPDASGISTPGNIKSIIASRISYLCDFKGPAVIVDTACSSSLVAIHLACESILRNECDMALAGSAKINIFPLKADSNFDIGIDSSDERTKTFDSRSDGTGRGEGVVVVLLKPLKKALLDRDHIYGVIKGSAVNQDGNSIGLTAPSANAQAEVIENAWKDAKVNPEDISYIEVHGTGTKLGDPIEISGITKAFEKYTKKKQFCAVSTIKTNIGHLDCASGIAGLIKILLSFKTKKLYPSVHFLNPNKNIDFVSGPVYMNEKLTDWTPSGESRIAGISSFGLSGTNCHLILAEPSEEVPCEENKNQFHLLPLSAKNSDALMQLVEDYNQFVKKHKNIDLEDMCYTASTGRGHYNYRLILVFQNSSELLEKLEKLIQSGMRSEEGIYYEAYRVISNENKANYDNGMIQITENDISHLTIKADEVLKLMAQDRDSKVNIEDLCRLYIQGAKVNWNLLYQTHKNNRISLPTYPFRKTRCWLENKNISQRTIEYNNIAVDKTDLVLANETMEQLTFKKTFHLLTDWTISEHKVLNEYVLPGTAYVELLLEIGQMYENINSIEDLVFLHPFTLKENESKDLCIVINKGESERDFYIASKSTVNDTYIKHAYGRFSPIKQKAKQYSFQTILERFKTGDKVAASYDSKGFITTKDRWNNIKELYVKDGECLVILQLSQAFRQDLNEHPFHPAMIDIAVNIGLHMIDEGHYLPFCYKKISAYHKATEVMYSVVKQSKNYNKNPHTMTYDISIFNEDGEVMIEIEDYTVKNADNFQFQHTAFKREWVQDNKKWEKKVVDSEESVLILNGTSQLSDKISRQIKKWYKNIYEVYSKNTFDTNENSILLNTKEDYLTYLRQLKDKKIKKVFHLMAISDDEIQSTEGLSGALNNSFYSLFHLVNSLVENQYKDEITIYLMCNNADKVTNHETVLHPEYGCYIGLGKTIREEYPNIKVRVADIDELTSETDVVEDLLTYDGRYLTAYRNGVKYVEKIDEVVLQENEEKQLKHFGGTYIITGGTGELGLEVGKYLSRIGATNIHLISRSGIAERDQWNHIVEENKDHAMIQKINAIKYMEKKGSEVCVTAINICDEENMNLLLESIRKKHKKIRGVIHCAGVSGEGFLFQKDESRIQEVLDAKVMGTYVLDQLTCQDDLDFFVMFSSISSIVGGIGQGDYAAANSYMDFYESYMVAQGRKSISINWPLWNQIGMGVRNKVSDEDSIFKGITTEQGVYLLFEIIHNQQEHIIPGELKQDMRQAKMGRYLENDYELSDTIMIRLKGRKELELKHNTNNKSTVTPKSSTKLEEEIVEIWSKVLGVSNIDIDDTFNSLGGNSVLAVDLFRRLESKYGGGVSVADVFTYPTVREFATYLSKRLNLNQPEYDDTDTIELLKRLANQEISMDDAMNQYKNV